MATGLSPNEEAQLLQTIEMFEVITQSQPADYQSLEILKEAYFKLGRQKDVVNTSKRIANAYVQMGQLSSAILEYESVLQLFPDDPDVRKALSEIENRASSFSSDSDTNVSELFQQSKQEISKPQPITGARISPSDINDGRITMRTILVEGKFMSDTDFKSLWPVPQLDIAPAKACDPFLQIIADKGILSLDKSLRLLCEKSRLCFLPVDKYDVDIEVARSFPVETCRRWCVLPFDRMSKSVLVATANPFNKQAARELENATRNRLIWYLASPTELTKAINRVFR